MRASMDQIRQKITDELYILNIFEVSGAIWRETAGKSQMTGDNIIKSSNTLAMSLNVFLNIYLIFFTFTKCAF